MSNRIRRVSPRVRTFFLSEMLRGEEEKIVSTGITRQEANKILLALRDQGCDITVRDGMFIADSIEQTFYLRPET